MNACKTGGMQIRSVSYTDINLLMLLLYYNDITYIMILIIKSYRWGNLGEGYLGPLCIIFSTSCESIIISKLKIKKN